MPGSNNRVSFANGFRLEQSAAEEWFLMQGAPNVTNVSMVNGQNDPNGVVQANPGSIYFDNLNGDIWKKDSGTGTTVWEMLATGGGDSVLSITGDSGGALIPTAGNLNILGLSGSKTSGASSTLTIKSPPYQDEGGSVTVTLNSGSFATGTITLTTPATAGLADGDLLEFVATTANVLTIQLAATQVAHIGNVATSVAGTLVSTAIGDSISLRYQASTNDWWTTSIVGNWTYT